MKPTLRGTRDNNDDYEKYSLFRNLIIVCEVQNYIFKEVKTEQISVFLSVCISWNVSN